MRILLAAQQSPHRYPIPAYHFWARYLRAGLIEAGHTVVEVHQVDWARGLLNLSPEELRSWRQESWGRTLESLRSPGGHADLFLGYLYPGQVEAAALSELRTRGIPSVNFFCDNVREFRRVPQEFHAFDLHWVPEAQALPLYRQAGLAHVHAPMPCWVDPKHRHADHAEEHGPVFIGSYDRLRAGLLGEAIRLGAPLKLHGTGWQDAPTENIAPDSSQFSRGRLLNQIDFIRRHGLRAWTRKLAAAVRPLVPPPSIPMENLGAPVRDEDYVRLTQHSEVTVGVNRFPSFRHSATHPGAYSRLRDIEAPMFGACYLTEWTEDIPHLYENGVEIETYRSAEELVEKLAKLHADPTRRQRLRSRGQARALSDHTIGRSLERIAATLGLRHSSSSRPA